MARKNDINDLPVRAAMAEKSLYQLSAAFDDVANKGKLTERSIIAMTGALVKLGPEMGALAIVGTGVVSMLTYFKHAMDEMDIADFNDEVRDLTDYFKENTSANAAQVGQLKEAAPHFAEAAKLRAKISEEESWYHEVVTRATKAVEGDADAIQRQTAALYDQEKRSEETIKKLQERAAAEEHAGQAARAQQILESQLTEAWILGSAENAKSASIIDRVTESRRKNISVLENQYTAEKAQADEEIRWSGSVSPKTQAALLESIELLREQKQALDAQTQAWEAAGSMIDSAIGQVASGAFDVYANALDKSISASNLFSATSGRAFQNAASSAIKSLGQQAAVEALMETAMGLRDLAFGLPSAGIHFESAAVFAAVALAAGVGAGALSVSPGRSAGAGGGNTGGGGTAGGGRGGPVIQQTVVVIGTLDRQGVEDLQAQLDAAAQSGDLSS